MGQRIGNLKDEIVYNYLYSLLFNESTINYANTISVGATMPFIFKINKGITEVSDNKKINKYVPEESRPIPFKRMIYFGDGETDIPCMKMVKANGGYSIAVYKPKDKGKGIIAEKLILDNRVNFVCQADYRDSQDIYKVVTTILKKIKRDYEFEELQKKHLESAKKSNMKK